MFTFSHQNQSFEIRPVTPDELEVILDVYRQCEDFLALGPVATASMEMVEKDIELSHSQDGIFCGIYTAGNEMIGVLDYTPSGWKGDPQAAYISLLMMAASWRNKGIGKAVVEAFEHEIRQNPRITTVYAGVQVNNPLAIRFWQANGYCIISGPILYPDQTTAFDLKKQLYPAR